MNMNAIRRTDGKFGISGLTPRSQVLSCIRTIPSAAEITIYNQECAIILADDVLEAVWSVGATPQASVRR